MLDQDRNWAEFMAFCYRNGLWDDRSRINWQPAAGEETRISRLEKRLLHQDEVGEHIQSASQQLENGVRKLGLAHDDVDELWRSGVAAEQDIVRQTQDQKLASDISQSLQLVTWNEEVR